MLTTSDPALDRRFRLLRQHGMSISDGTRRASRGVVFEEYPIVGFNYRLTDIQAAIGRAQLRRLPQSLSHRRKLADRYAMAIREIPGLEAPTVPIYARPNYESYPVRVRADYPLCRDELIQELFQNRVSTRRGIMNAHEERAYADLPRNRLEHSEAAHDEVILLPLYDSMSKAEQR